MKVTKDLLDAIGQIADTMRAKGVAQVTIEGLTIVLGHEPVPEEKARPTLDRDLRDRVNGEPVDDSLVFWSSNP